MSSVQEYARAMLTSEIIYTGIRDIAPSGDDVIFLAKDDLSLVRPNEMLLSKTCDYVMSRQDMNEAATASRYLVCKYSLSVPGLSEAQARERGKDRFYAGLVALQIIKPIRTLGFIYSSELECRPKMEPSQWALERQFDNAMLALVPELIDRIQKVMNGDNAELKNALILLQLGLEHVHPLVAGLFWVMGMEAIFDSRDRQDFKAKLCDCLGTDALAFPAWSTPAPTYEVGEIAIDLYMLRNKLAHGVDLRKARLDKATPVDLAQQVHPSGFSEPVAYAIVLSEAALFLLCQVLQRRL